jgi:hypothetical protein
MADTLRTIIDMLGTAQRSERLDLDDTERARLQEAIYQIEAIGANRAARATPPPATDVLGTTSAAEDVGIPTQLCRCARFTATGDTSARAAQLRAHYVECAAVEKLAFTGDGQVAAVTFRSRT